MIRRSACVLLVVALGLAAVPGTATAQGASLQGTVTSADTNDPLPLATVRLQGSDRGTVTDSLGRFQFASLQPGRYTLLISYVGFESTQRSLTLQAGATRSIRIALRPTELAVDGVTVTGTRVEERDLGAARITPDEIKALPTVLEPDLFRSLQLLPGIKAASDFSSGLYVRGGSPDQTLVLLDQAPLYNPTHVFGFFSTFNPDAIGDVLLYKGGFPAEYGGRLGAVVDIQTRRSADDLEGGLSLGMLASRAYAAGPIEGENGGSGSWMVAARRSTLEPLLAGLNSAGVDGVPQRFAFYDVNASVSYAPTPDDRFFLTAYGGRDGLEYPFLEDALFDIAYGNRAATGAWRHVLTDRWVTRVTASVTQYFSDPTAELAGTRFVRDTDVVDAKLEADATWQATDRHTLSGGLTAGRFTSRMRNRFDGNVGFSPRIQTIYGALHLQDRYTPAWAPNLEVTGGVRVSAFPQSNSLRVAPRLRGEYQLSDRLRLQAGYGRYVQYVTAATTELFSAFDFWLTSGEGVPPAYGDQFLAGLKTQPTEAVSVDLELYYRTMRNLFDLDRLKQDYTGLDYSELFLQGRGEAYGAELTLRKQAGRVNGFVGYSLSRTTRTFEVLADGPFPPKYDRTHDVTAVANYDLADDWRLTAVFTYATGQAYTEPNGYLKALDDPFSSRPRTAFVTEYNAARLPAYHRLDVGLRKKGDFFGWARYEAQVQIVNAYARRNVWFVIFEPTDDNRIRRDVVPQIPVPLPNLSLSLSF